MEALAGAAADAYVTRVLPALRAALPDDCVRYGEALRTLLRNAVDRADAHGITTEVNVYCWLQLTVVFGDEFDGQAWARQVLGERFPEDDAIDLLCAVANEILGEP